MAKPNAAWFRPESTTIRVRWSSLPATCRSTIGGEDHRRLNSPRRCRPARVICGLRAVATRSLSQDSRDKTARQGCKNCDGTSRANDSLGSCIPPCASHVACQIVTASARFHGRSRYPFLRVGSGLSIVGLATRGWKLCEHCANRLGNSFSSCLRRVIIGERRLRDSSPVALP